MSEPTKKVTPEEATQALKELLQSVPKEDRHKLSGVAKNLTILIIFLSFVMGVVGSIWDAFSMDKYTQFLPVFAMLFVPLIISIGSNAVAKTIKKDGEK